jgi:hypothetical protein
MKTAEVGATVQRRIPRVKMIMEARKTGLRGKT